MRIPDLDRTTRGEVREWKYVARILAGETVTDPRLGMLESELQEAPTEPIHGDRAFAVVCELAAQVGDERVVLGQQGLHISVAHVASHRDSNGETDDHAQAGGEMDAAASSEHDVTCAWLPPVLARRDVSAAAHTPRANPRGVRCFNCGRAVRRPFRSAARGLRPLASGTR
jgi:hypothetical protein